MRSNLWVVFMDSGFDYYTNCRGYKEQKELRIHQGNDEIFISVTCHIRYLRII